MNEEFPDYLKRDKRDTVTPEISSFIQYGLQLAIIALYCLEIEREKAKIRESKEISTKKKKITFGRFKILPEWQL